MELNADFSQRVVVHGDETEWLGSPIEGISRRMLDRIGDEVARATSIVRYDENSQFSPHVHTGGEEFIVLDGVFQDEHGDFPAGSYIRNPPESSHTPGSEAGCVIFVKLWQFEPSDRTHVRVQFDKMSAIADPTRTGVTVTPLYKDAREDVRIENWSAGADVEVESENGAEILVLEGGFEESGDSLRPQSWLRSPIGGKVRAKAGPKGARVWIKSGHIRFVEPPKVA